MGQYIVAWDLGTGGNKASLYDVDGNCLAASFVPYETFYPAQRWHEQRPLDWWGAVVESTRQLLSTSDVERTEIECCSISGHSLGVVPLDRAGRLLRESTPVWSDARATAQVASFFERVEESEWYRLTGNGFPPPLYSVFKIMWYRDNEPEMFDRIDKLGSLAFAEDSQLTVVALDFQSTTGEGAQKIDFAGVLADVDEAACPGQARTELAHVEVAFGIVNQSCTDFCREYGSIWMTNINFKHG